MQIEEHWKAALKWWVPGLEQASRDIFHVVPE